MKNLIYFVLIALFFSCSTTQIMEQPEVMSYSSEEATIPQGIPALDNYIQEYVDNGVIPGGVFYVSHKGKIVYHKAFGERAEKSNIFRIASMTKAVTSTAIMQLYERGKLRLDDPIDKYLPAFADPTVLDEYNEDDDSYTTLPANKSITIRHLLTHTSGIYYGPFQGGNREKVYAKYNLGEFGLSTPEISTQEMANMIAKTPLAHHPGEQWTYGLNMDVLGAIVEVISGKDLFTYFSQNIFQPLGMEDTYFYLPESKVAQLVPVFTYDENGKLMVGDAQSDFGDFDYPALQDEPSHFAGGGGLSSTAADYGKFVQMLLDKGIANGKRVLARHTVELMTTDQINHLNLQGKGMTKIPGISFCLGHAYVTESGAGVGPHKPGSFSWGGYFNSKWWADPEEELLFVGMTNILPFPHGEFWDKMYPIIYASLDDL